MDWITELFRGESVLEKSVDRLHGFKKHSDDSRKVLLITTAIGEKYQKIGEGLEWMGADLSPKPTDINWSGEYDMRKLPRISRTGFDIAVHYAVAVMKKSVYHDEKKTLSQKMLSARLWEHRGGDAAELMELGDARGLELEDLETIYAIEEVGDTKYSNKEISEKFYRKLMSRWKYFPLWWNCHDLAIRLAYLIIANKSSKAEKSERILTHFLISLKKSLIDRVVKKAEQFGWKAVVSCWVGIGILGLLFPPAAVGETALFVTWCATLFGAQAIRNKVTEGSSEFAIYNERLQHDFPSLATLHRKLSKGLSELAEERREDESHASKRRPVEGISTWSSGISSSRSNRKQLESFRSRKSSRNTRAPEQCNADKNQRPSARAGRRQDRARAY